MDDNEQTSEIQSSAEQAFIIASIACFASLTLVYWVARPVVELLEIRWLELLIYSVIPISLVFVILYRSCWHPQITGAARTSVLLLLSCVVLIGVLLTVWVLLGFLWFCLYALSSGPGPG